MDEVITGVSNSVIKSSFAAHSIGGTQTQAQIRSDNETRSSIITKMLLDIIYQFSRNGALTWLCIVVVLSVLGSLLPAIRATRVSVRQSLAYE